MIMSPETVTTSKNRILLFQTEYREKSPYRTYREWSGSYSIIESDNPVTREDVNELRERGFFGSGQTVTATLVSNRSPDEMTLTQVIRYSGICDSGD